jgi:hypothetical protein
VGIVGICRRRRREDNKGKKKCVNKKDFIRSVGKYSDIIIII